MAGGPAIDQPPQGATDRRSRPWLLLMLLAVTAVAWWLLSGGGPLRPAPRDLLLITVDTLRTDRVGAYGWAAARTPYMDALAARGLRFTSAVTPLPRTTPALASLLTGLWAHHHGSREVGDPLRHGTLLSELLATRGFTTMAVSANPTVGPAENLARGFSTFAAAIAGRERTADQATDIAIELLGRADPQRPLFLWVHYFDPHFPYEPPPSWPHQPAAPACRELQGLFRRGGIRIEAIFNNQGGVVDGALAGCSALYDAEIAFTDYQIGRLLDEYGRRRELDRTLVVLSSDHGEQLGEGGLYFEHGTTVHDAGLKVPLVVAGPGIRRGVDDILVGLEDLAPTCLGLLGVPPEQWPEMDGQDLSARLAPIALPWLEPDALRFAEGASMLFPRSPEHLHSGEATGLHCLNGERFSLCGEPGREPGLYDHVADPELSVDLSALYPERRRELEAARAIWPPEQARERTVRNGHFKLVERPRLEGGYSVALYDLARDPQEKDDIAAELPELRDRLRAALESWAREIPTATAVERSQSQLDALRALGYVE